jgi:hypothetical protein
MSILRARDGRFEGRASGLAGCPGAIELDELRSPRPAAPRRLSRKRVRLRRTGLGLLLLVQSEREGGSSLDARICAKPPVGRPDAALAEDPLDFYRSWSKSAGPELGGATPEKE